MPRSLAANPELAARVAAIRFLLLDVDGVLTDGSIIYADDGTEWKKFHVRDGTGIKLWRLAGHDVGILSGRTSAATRRRATELGISVVLQGQENKADGLAMILAQTGLQAAEICALGDDLADLPLFHQVGVAIAVADACPELLAKADYRTQEPGGHGAVRAAVEWLLQGQGRWETLLDRYRIRN